MKKIRFAILYLAWLILVYLLIRVIFYFLYYRHGLAGTSLSKAFLWGCRLDFSILFFLNLPFLFFYFFAAPFVPTRVSRVISYILLWALNMLMLALNIFDLAYFRYNNRRSNVDILYVTGDSFKAGFFFLRVYWPLLLLLGVIAVISYRLMRNSVLQSFLAKDAPIGRKFFFVAVLLLLLSAYLATGDDFRPLVPAAPLIVVEPELLPLAENSTITFVYSLLKKQTALPMPHYFPEKQLDTLFSVKREYNQQFVFSKKNIVIFILESFSASMANPNGAQKAQTPFIDSLRQISMDCPNAFSNAMESNKAIVALLGSIPPLMDEPFYYSAYSTVPFRGLGTLLKENGYSTHFFMGASPDHFGFGKWSHMLGIDNYYSEKEYNHPEDNDGKWGIYDHLFFPYAAGVLKSARSPFLAVLFNISSHPPFSIPASLHQQFTVPGQNSQQNSISYADYALRLFFNSIKNEPWYDSTLFVFSADHPLAERRGIKADLYNFFEIPVFFHIPSVTKGSVVTKTVQQLDIVPTVLDMLHYKRPFMSFGNSILRQGPGYSVSKIFDTIQMIDSSYVTGYNQRMDSVLYFYNYKNDPALDINLVQLQKKPPELEERKLQLKAFIQRFDHSLRNNQLLLR